eukprot:TRINITY_DN37294_c0_g3_i2.p1 TRINITY_DN37294_c0_g3~~TRINITY_DN37294_c0_g3_i2.p1  ORF type:complete len:505 (-),score=34.74 TRINITY_DN37294_c0_g3_i2:311-1825(-)
MHTQEFQVSNPSVQHKASFRAYSTANDKETLKQTLTHQRNYFVKFLKELDLESRSFYVDTFNDQHSFSQHAGVVLKVVNSYMQKWMQPFSYNEEEKTRIVNEFQNLEQRFQSYSQADLQTRQQIVKEAEELVLHALNVMVFEKRQAVELSPHFLHEAEEYYIDSLSNNHSYNSKNQRISIEQTEQRSEGWHQQRLLRLTASDFSTALGLWGQERVEELFAAKVGYGIPFQGNEATQYGEQMEATALEQYVKFTGFKVSHSGLVGYKNERCEWLAGSPDGLIDGIQYEREQFSGYQQSCFQQGKKGLLEIKCPHLRNFPYNSFPPYYMPQIQGLMQFTDRTWCHLYSWTQGSSALFYIERDDNYWEVIVDLLKQFWWKHAVPARRLYELYGQESAEEQVPLVNAQTIETVRKLNKDLASKAVKYSFEHEVQQVAEHKDNDEQRKILPAEKTYNGQLGKGHEQKQIVYQDENLAIDAGQQISEQKQKFLTPPWNRAVQQSVGGSMS